jgi:predicted TIM-barrel fold metal-dependent hydrolase
VTVLVPATDDEVPAFWRSLGLPGLIDVHTHFLPKRLLDAVWDYFDRAGPLVGTQWPIGYRFDEDERLARLRAFGVRAFTALVYPHKPGMAASLNDWATDFSRRTPDCLLTATFFPEPEAASYVAEAIDGGAQIFKSHIQVGDYDPRDPLLDPVWGLLADAGVPVIVHAGSGPMPGRFTGVEPIAEVLARHPRLPAIIAHLGLPECHDFLDLADRYPDVRFDLTMAFTDFTLRGNDVSPRLVARLEGLTGRLMHGSDYPNIPYAYADQLAALARLGLGDEWLRAVCWGNAAELFGVAAPEECVGD